jgi:hypothetical protein
MKIGLYDHENNGYPNLALMKISAWHKAHGVIIRQYTILSHGKIIKHRNKLTGGANYGKVVCINTK